MFNKTENGIRDNSYMYYHILIIKITSPCHKSSSICIDLAVTKTSGYVYEFKIIRFVLYDIIISSNL